jgi:hypothetical protein
MRRTALAAFAALFATPVAAAPVTLGAWTFDSSLFGNSLIESDGGTFSATSWLNTVNANPGNPAFLTGANFNTGIANIGGSNAPTYTIGYGTPIVNNAGNDLAIVSARFSTNDTFNVTINATTVGFGPGLASATGVSTNYYFSAGFGSLFPAELFVTEIDLSAFGIAAGGSISSLTITGTPEADLIRVAGFDGHAAVVVETPEPASLALLGAGLLGLAAGTRRRRSA